MPDSHARAARFETHRPHLLAVATRLLGSVTEAEDAVQEAWFRLERAGDEGIQNLGGWLTTVVSRISLDHLRTRSSRSEEPVDSLLEPGDAEPGPEDVALLTESTAEALAVVVDTLAPIERVTFVLHDVFGIAFDDIAAMVDRSPAATRQVASRARRKARAAAAPVQPPAHTPRELVAAFFTASREGRFDTLVQLLAPGVVLRADAVAAHMGARSGWLASDLEGADVVASQFSGRAEAALLATIDGQYGAAWVTGATPRVIFRFTIESGVIVAITLVGDPAAIAAMDVAIVDDRVASTSSSLEPA